MPGPVIKAANDRQANKGVRQPRSPLWRLRLWQVLILVGLAVVLARLYYLQLIKGPELTRRATIQRQQSNLLVHRGAITDRHGLPLAIDTTRYDIYLHPELLQVSQSEAIEKLAHITHTDTERLNRLFLQGYPIITLARHLGREEVDELQALNWPGIDIVPRAFRHYPEGKLAAHVLGYVNIDTHGQGGVEQAEESKLKDTGSLNKPQLDGHGRPIFVKETAPIMEITPPLGRQVELTIDNYLQHLAEKELSAMVNHSMALRGTAILADPSTGEILAWANCPSYDPNDYSKFPYAVTKNWSMVDVYQPGSTFKILTVASGLDTGAINLNSTFYDSGALKVGNRIIHNHEPGGHGAVDLLHLFIHSSNVAAAQIGLAMKPSQFHEKLSQFGIGRRTGIDLHGESKGLLLDAKYWRPIDQATTGFGQGAVAVTPLQLVAAIGSIANGGTWVQPHVIRRIYDPRTGATEQWTEPQRNQAISKSTAQVIAKLLAENIDKGTQLAGKLAGYRVAGKTGTAQKAIEGGRGYIAGQTIASFIGFLPADNPQLVCLVVVDSPQTDGRWGNTIAGPVFNAICIEAARYLGIPPQEKTRVDNVPGERANGKTFIAPSVMYANENKPGSN